MLANAYDIAVTSSNEEKNKKDLVGYFNTTFLQVAPIIKDVHFHEENEWRIITPSTPCTDANFGARISNRRVFEYYSLSFGDGQEFLKEIVIGPTKEPGLIGDAFRVLMAKNGMKYSNMHFSKIPFRRPY